MGSRTGQDRCWWAVPVIACRLHLYFSHALWFRYLLKLKKSRMVGITCLIYEKIFRLLYPQKQVRRGLFGFHAVKRWMKEGVSDRPNRVNYRWTLRGGSISDNMNSACIPSRYRHYRNRYHPSIIFASLAIHLDTNPDPRTHKPTNHPGAPELNLRHV